MHSRRQQHPPPTFCVIGIKHLPGIKGSRSELPVRRGAEAPTPATPPPPSLHYLGDDAVPVVDEAGHGDALGDDEAAVGVDDPVLHRAPQLRQERPFLPPRGEWGMLGDGWGGGGMASKSNDVQDRRICKIEGFGRQQREKEPNTCKTLDQSWGRCCVSKVQRRCWRPFPEDACGY